MQNQETQLRENPKYRIKPLFWIFVVLPLLVFAASSAYSVLALWRAKSLQALAAPEIQRLPFGMWVGNDITWAMKFAILGAGYFSLLLAYSARKQLWRNKAKLGILGLLGAAQALLCLDYIAKLQWFADDGVTAKGLVIIGFTAINAFLLAIMRNTVKAKMAALLIAKEANRFLLSSSAPLSKIFYISLALAGLGLSLFWHGGQLAALFIEISGYAIPFRKLGFLLVVVASLPCLLLRLQSALPVQANSPRQKEIVLPSFAASISPFIPWPRRIAFLLAYLAGASLLLKVNGLINVSNQLFFFLSGTAVVIAYSLRFLHKLSIFREPLNYLKIGYEFALVSFIICSFIFSRGILNGSNIQSLYEVAGFWLLALFVCSLLSLNPKQTGKAIIWVLTTWVLGILFLYIFLAFFNTNWPLNDAEAWLRTTVIGKPFPPLIGIGGRFYPLGHMAYNWVIYFPFRKSLIPYLLQNAVTLLGGTGLLYFAMPKRNTASQIVCLCSLLFILQAPMMGKIFMDIIYPEKNLYVLLPWFLFSLRYAEKQKTSYLRYILALLPLMLATYTKEPVFVISLVYGLGRFLFCRDTKAQKLFNYLLIFNAIVFLILYYLWAYTPGPNYASVRQTGTVWDTTQNMIFKWTYGIIILPLFWAVFRCYRFVFRGDRNFILADMLLFGGFAYIACYWILRFDSSTYSRYLYIPGFILVFYAINNYISYYICLAKVQSKRLKSHFPLFIVIALIGLQLLLYILPMQSSNISDAHQLIRSKEDSVRISKELSSLISKGWSIYIVSHQPPVKQAAEYYARVFNLGMMINKKKKYYYKTPEYIQALEKSPKEDFRYPQKSLILFDQYRKIEPLDPQLFEFSQADMAIYYLGRIDIKISEAYSIGEIPTEFVEKFGLNPVKLPPPEEKLRSEPQTSE